MALAGQENGGGRCGRDDHAPSSGRTPDLDACSGEDVVPARQSPARNAPEVASLGLIIDVHRGSGIVVDGQDEILADPVVDLVVADIDGKVVEGVVWRMALVVRVPVRVVPLMRTRGDQVVDVPIAVRICGPCTHENGCNGKARGGTVGIHDARSAG